MQRIREDSIGEVGLAEALVQALLLKLNVNGLFPSHYIDREESKACVRFRGGIVDYDVLICENGLVSIALVGLAVWHRLVVSGSYMSNPFFNPDIVLGKIVKAALYIDSLKDHMANVDTDWLLFGINTVINGSSKIITEKKKWKTLPADYMTLNLPCHIEERYMKSINSDFYSEYYCEPYLKE